MPKPPNSGACVKPPLLLLVGRHFAGKTDGINNGMTPRCRYSLPAKFQYPDDPFENYWNGNSGVQTEWFHEGGNQG